MQIYAYIIDIILLIIAALFLFAGFKKGFLHMIIALIGYIAAILIASKLSHILSGYFYQNFIYGNIVEKINLAISQGVDTLDIQALAQTAIVAVPMYIASLLKTNFGGMTGIEEKLLTNEVATKQDIGATITDLIITPTIEPLMRAIIYIILFAIMAIIVSWIARFLTRFNSIPILGPINSLLGGAMGIAQAAVIFYLIAFVVGIVVAVTSGSLVYLNNDVISKTYLFKLFYTSKFI